MILRTLQCVMLCHAEAVCYLDPVLPLTQLPVAQRRPAVMTDGHEAPGEGDVPAPALGLQLLVFHLLLHLDGDPELMLRGRPAVGGEKAQREEDANGEYAQDVSSSDPDSTD